MASAVPDPPCRHATDNIGDLGIRRIEQIALTDKRVLDSAGKLEPLLARTGAEIAERANGLLPRTFRRVDRFHQHVIDGGLAVLLANRFADVHDSLYIENNPMGSG